MVTDVTSPLGAKVMLAVPGPPRPSFSLHEAAMTPHLFAAALAALLSNFDDSAVAGALGAGATGVGEGPLPFGAAVTVGAAEGVGAVALGVGSGKATGGVMSGALAVGPGVAVGVGSPLGTATLTGTEGVAEAVAVAAGPPGFACLSPRFKNSTSPPAPARRRTMAATAAITSPRPFRSGAGAASVCEIGNVGAACGE